MSIVESSAGTFKQGIYTTKTSNLQSKRLVTGFGGLVLPIIMTAVSNKLGVQWYMFITEACDHIYLYDAGAFAQLPLCLVY